jgi:hypothetical protein
MTAETTGTARLAPGGRRRAEQLALLGLAMIAGVVGFVLVVFWGIALILMGVLWGMMAMERQRVAESEKGVLAEVVDVVVDAAKGVARSGSRHDGDAPASQDPPRRVASSSQNPPRRVASSSQHPPRQQDWSAPAPASHDPFRQDAAYDPPRT